VIHKPLNKTIQKLSAKLSKEGPRHLWSGVPRPRQPPRSPPIIYIPGDNKWQAGRLHSPHSPQKQCKIYPLLAEVLHLVVSAFQVACTKNTELNYLVDHRLSILAKEFITDTLRISERLNTFFLPETSYMNAWS